jgi:hypothetical protein
MRDFTLSAYKDYLLLIKKSIPNFITFSEFMSLDEKPQSFCLIRHDVDRKPINALKMAELEHQLNIKSTYYFRYKPNTFKPDIFKKIAAMGHEIGYHYENLSDCNGNFDTALKDFEYKLNEFRKYVEIKTISMHGRPLKKFDNRDLWKDPVRHSLLKNKFNILGEVYLDIDYSDIAYINDTGRNWTNSKSNIRDKVNSNIQADFKNQAELIDYLAKTPHPKICFQIHPERWDDDFFPWFAQLAKDNVINSLKYIFNLNR